MKRIQTLSKLFVFVTILGAQFVTAQNSLNRVINGLSHRNAIKGQKFGMNLFDRMKYYQVPDVSIAVINQGKITWAKEFSKTSAKTNSNTRFQAGSISKPVTAMAVLRLAQGKKLSLDEDISFYLKSWQIPPNEFTDKQKITLRQILSHTAGFNVHGFKGYTDRQNVPTLLQVLNGTPPANSPKIRVEYLPSGDFRYSGGGYVVLQQLLTDISKTDFADLMSKEVLTPTGMKNSTFDQNPLKKSTAKGHDRNGKPINGNHYIYPEMAAAGLWTTAEDLAKLVINLQNSLKNGKGFLSADLAREMLTPQKYDAGLGFFVGGTESDKYFVHDGATEGFQAMLVGFQKSGKGAIVLTNSNRGLDLAYEIRRAIAVEYKWSAFTPNFKEVIQLKSADFRQYEGEFEGLDGQTKVNLKIISNGKNLRVASTYWQGFRVIYPTTRNKFFTLEGDWEMDFIRDENGSVKELQFGPIKMPKRIN